MQVASSLSSFQQANYTQILLKNVYTHTPIYVHKHTHNWVIVSTTFQNTYWAYCVWLFQNFGMLSQHSDIHM